MGDGHRHHECSVPDCIDLKYPGRQHLLARNRPQLVRLPHGQRREIMDNHESALIGGTPDDPTGGRRGGGLGTGQGGDPRVGMRDKVGEHALLHQLLRQLLVHPSLLSQLYLRVVQGQPQHADEAGDSHSPAQRARRHHTQAGGRVMLNDGAGTGGACAVRTRASSFSRSSGRGETAGAAHARVVTTADSSESMLVQVRHPAARWVSNWVSSSPSSAPMVYRAAHSVNGSCLTIQSSLA